MMPKRTTTPMTDAAIKALIAQGVATAVAEYEANRGSGNGEDSHDSRNGRRTERAAREIKKLEIEIWNLKVKGTDVVSYTQRFQELALLCGRMFLEVSDMVEKYVGGLPDMIQEIQDVNRDPDIVSVVKLYFAMGSVMTVRALGFDGPSWGARFVAWFPVRKDDNGSVIASKPKTMQDAIEFATELMDQKIHTFAYRQAKKRSLMITQEATRINNNPSRSRMLLGPTLLGPVRRKCTEDLNLCTLNATTITRGNVYQGATIARKLAICPVIVGVLLLMLMLTTKETPGQIRGLPLDLSVEFRGITRGIS
ncbi:hypothetical protein Tco_1080588 [Tanacetum coccineum]|uniref:Reverse transcriptase domain-containing protein n=1 Tax=Tanacetum coccineum TaxID=301880 RepID=A0ABQ5HV81_9ASTR